jgi:hypothetical protein
MKRITDSAVVPVRVKQDRLEKLNQIAARDGCSAAWLIRQGIDLVIEKKAGKKRPKVDYQMISQDVISRPRRAYLMTPDLMTPATAAPESEPSAALPEVIATETERENAAGEATAPPTGEQDITVARVMQQALSEFIARRTK